jgi:poly(A) polymerase
MPDSQAKSNVTSLRPAPRIIPRTGHTISRANIDDKALKVLYRLKNAGFQAYLVGGGVRDLLLGREPKDFDVATNALPEQVRELFRNCRLIGRRFRLAHVHFGREVVEVATFRAQHDADGEGMSEDGRILRDNVYGDINDDVWRRDFTVNALYYNIEDFSVVDYAGGMEDIKAGQIRVIGDPRTRYREDPVRMLRAIRFATKLGFTMHPATADPIYELGHLLQDIPPARLFEEVLKLFFGGAALQTFEQLRHYRLFGYLFPQAEGSLSEEEGGFPHMLLVRALENTDARVAEGKPVTPAFLLAALLWDPLQKQMEEYRANEVPDGDAMQLAADAVISRQIARIAMPRRFTLITREIWLLQHRFNHRVGKRPSRFLAHPRFRAAYDFLVLRAQAGENLQELADWWTEFQEGSQEHRQTLQDSLHKPTKSKRRRSRRKAAPQD